MGRDTKGVFDETENGAMMIRRLKTGRVAFNASCGIAKNLTRKHEEGKDATNKLHVLRGEITCFYRCCWLARH
jgi:hypothetical protein